MWEVFYIVAKALATGSEPLQTRLQHAFSYTVSRLVKPHEDLPRELADKYVEARDLATCVPATGDEGTIAATCRVISDEEAEKIAELLFSIFNEVCQMYGADNDRRE